MAINKPMENKAIRAASSSFKLSPVLSKIPIKLIGMPNLINVRATNKENFSLNFPSKYPINKHGINSESR